MDITTLSQHCPHCGKPLDIQVNPGPQQRHCRVCANPTKRGQYCSNKCRQRAYRERKHELQYWERKQDAAQAAMDRP